MSSLHVVGEIVGAMKASLRWSSLSSVATEYRTEDILPIMDCIFVPFKFAL
jgi:hypothetical protein